jgi:hypothetical protein
VQTLGANMSAKTRKFFNQSVLQAEAQCFRISFILYRNGVDPSVLMSYRKMKSTINSFCTYDGLDSINPTHPNVQYVYYNIIQMITSRIRLPSEIIPPIQVD